jgi:hypothetical protein
MTIRDSDFLPDRAPAELTGGDVSPYVQLIGLNRTALKVPNSCPDVDVINSSRREPKFWRLRVSNAGQRHLEVRRR